MSTTTRELLEFIYGAAGGEVDERLDSLMNRYREHLSTPDGFKRGAIPLAERDSIMIAYGDSFRGDDGPPLSYLLRFLDEEAEGVVSGVHVLPFSPYSSDDGFSVIDYREVNTDFGSWEDVEAIGEEFVLMVDLVLNHCSAQGPWFEAFLRDEEPYNRYFITVPKDTDVSSVARPRAHPLLTPFETDAGTKYVWTTFSADQVDLDFANPEVLLEMMDIFLGYIARGASVVRLDAIAYLWKELGTSCLHLPQTHAVVKLMRAIVEDIAPWVVIITETNVPHEENVSYFGDGDDEAHMVYNFSLPPLTLDAFLRGDSSHLQSWAATLATGSRSTTYFNFLASHDGIGLLPAKGILSTDEVEALIATVKDRGGRISYKSTPEGEVPYEMNINYLSAIAPPALPDEQRAALFLAAQSIMLALAGVPGIYYHSLIGSENWQEGVEETGHNRTINREKLDYDALSGELNEPDTLRSIVFEGLKGYLRARASSTAFHPSASQRIMETPPAVFSVLRGERDAAGAEGDERVLCLVNVSDEEAEVSFTDGELGLGEEKGFRDLVSGDYVFPSRDHGNRVSLELEPYEVLWLRF
jgi:glucosylglycerate phosphorylase